MGENPLIQLSKFQNFFEENFVIQGIERFSEINKNLQTKLFFKPVRFLSINCARASIKAETSLPISLKFVESHDQ